MKKQIALLAMATILLTIMSSAAMENGTRLSRLTLIGITLVKLLITQRKKVCLLT